MRYGTTLVLAILVLLAAVIIAAYWPELTGEQKPAEKPKDALSLIEDLKSEDLATVVLEEAGPDGKMKTKVAFKQTDRKWRMTEPVDAQTDSYEVGRLIGAALEGRYKQSIEPGAKGQPAADALGLVPPAFRLTLTAEAKAGKPARTITVEVGRRAAFGEGLYVRLAGQDKVVMLEKADLLERARQKVDTYRSRDLVSLLREDVVRIELKGEKGEVRIDRAEGSDDRWVLAQPLAARADGEAVSAVLRSALGANVKDFVDDAPSDLDRYGLARPRLTVTLYKKAPPADKPKDVKAEGDKKSDEKDKPATAPEPVKAAVIRFGAWADLKKETVFAQVDDSKSVVSVSADTLTGVNKGAADLRDKHVIALDTARTTRLSVRVPAKLAEKDTETTYELVKAEGAWTLKVAGRPDAKADAQAVESLLKELADLKVLYFAEGDNADVAKSFSPQGAVRATVEKESAETGFEIAAGGEIPALVKNIREDWIGRINEKDLVNLRKDWLDLIDKQVLKFDPKQATRIAIQSAERTVVLEKKDDKWTMTAPVSAEPQAAFASSRLADLQDLRATKFVAATADYKPYNLQTGQVVVTVTLKGEKEGDKPVEKTLRLARRQKAAVVGRVDGSDLVFEVPLTLLTDLASEPVARELTDLAGKTINRIDVTSSAAKVTLLKVDAKWFRADSAGRPGEEVQTQAAEDIVKAATDLKVLRWAAYDASQAASFGLDKPEVAVTVSGDAAKATILISAKEVPASVTDLFDERPIRFAMTEGGKRIGLVAGQQLETLLSAAKAFEPKKEEPKKDEPKKDEPKPADK